MLRNLSEFWIYSSALRFFSQKKTLMFAVAPNSLDHESFSSWSLRNQSPLGDSSGDTLYQEIKAVEDSGSH